MDFCWVEFGRTTLSACCPHVCSLRIFFLLMYYFQSFFFSFRIKYLIKNYLKKTTSILFFNFCFLYVVF